MANQSLTFRHSTIFTVLMLLLCLGLWSLPADAYKPGEFPGKGSRQAWREAGTLYNEAYDMTEQGHYVEAIQKCKEAISIYEYDSSYWNKLGTIYTALKNFKAAEPCFRKAIELNPENWSPWSNLANNIDDQGRLLVDEKAAFLHALSCKYSPPPEDRRGILHAIESIDRDLKRGQLLAK